MKAKTRLVILLTVFVILPGIIYSQNAAAAAASGNPPAQEDTTEQGFFKKAGSYLWSKVKTSGEAGFYGELYSISGRDNRRPGQTGRIFLRPTIAIFDNFSLSVDMFLSTEGSALSSQQMNTMALHPTWGWSKWHIGDFSHELSKYTLSGLNIRGAGVELYPGDWLRLQVVGGQSQRAVNNGPNASTYARYVIGGKLGFGSETSYFDINVVRSKDDIKSLPRDMFRQTDTITSNSATKIETSYIGVTPQENLVLGVATAFKLFGGAISFKGEGAGSLFTRDMTANQIESNDIPKELNQVFIARQSSNADYAYSADMNINLRTVNAKLGYSEIGPGYTSMGLSYIINDKRTMNGALGFNLFAGGLSLQGTYQMQTDNLVKQKTLTNNRNAYGLTANMRPVKFLNISLNGTFNNITNDSKNDTLKLNTNNIGLNSNVSIQLPVFGFQNTISLNYGRQMQQDKNILRQGNDITSQNMSLNLTTMIDQQWNVSLGTNFNIVDIQNREGNTTSGANIRINNRMFNNKLNNNLSYGLNNSPAAAVHSINFQSAYPVTGSSALSFIYHASIYRGKGFNRLNFIEMTTSLGYTFRF